MKKFLYFYELYHFTVEEVVIQHPMFWTLTLKKFVCRRKKSSARITQW